MEVFAKECWYVRIILMNAAYTSTSIFDLEREREIVSFDGVSKFSFLNKINGHGFGIVAFYLFICLFCCYFEGLLRCGKSCRLRWINYLRTDLKRGNISDEEEHIIIKLHASMGNRLVPLQ